MTTATANAFNYGLTQSLAEMTLPPILTAARWGVLAYDVLTSKEARQTYAWVGSMAIALGQLVFWSVVWVYAHVAQWAEAQVQAAIPSPADPFSPESNPHHATVPAVIAAPVATLTVKVQPPVTTLTSAELRRHCQSAGIKWRNAHAPGRHLSKAEMIAALG